MQKDNGSHRCSPEDAAVMLHLNERDDFHVTLWEDCDKLEITVTRSINFTDVS
jgi:hypothetical protein